jgi:hypothetical protein
MELAHMARKPRTVGELEDELKHRDRRIEELREELDEQRDLVPPHGGEHRRLPQHDRALEGILRDDGDRARQQHRPIS